MKKALSSLKKYVFSRDEGSCREGLPKILLLVDRPGWAFDVSAKSIESSLSHKYSFQIAYVCENPNLSKFDFDIMHVFFWGERYHEKFGISPGRIIKEISSHRWAYEGKYGPCSPLVMAEKYLSDAGTVIATSKRLQSEIGQVRDVMFTPNGIDLSVFNYQKCRAGAMRIGWAGNASDPCKGYRDILLTAAGSEFELIAAEGAIAHNSMGEFYNDLDVICVASTAEGEPLTLIEAMACGCFPVCVDVGIVQELITHRKNGLIVDRTPESFLDAFRWCRENLSSVREMGRENARKMEATRGWGNVATYWEDAYDKALHTSPSNFKPKSVKLKPTEATKDANWQANLGGESLKEWPDRARRAAKIIRSLPWSAGDTVVDLGCGHQALRDLIPSALQYFPVDRVMRSPDTNIMDLDSDFPKSAHHISVALGLLEYIQDPPKLLSKAFKKSNYCIFSFNDTDDLERRKRQHWQNHYSSAELQTVIKSSGGILVEIIDLGYGLKLYVVARNDGLALDFKRKKEAGTKTLALFSAAVTGANSGDAVITDAIQRILGNHNIKLFPLLEEPTSAHIEEINSCDMAIICGTNLYQHVFACALTPTTIGQIKVPILPFGVGSSSSIGKMPQMNDEGVRAVRMLHERCIGSSVRDPMTLKFLKSIGVTNSTLTACPVLFHSLFTPDFYNNSGTGTYLSIRARLLHVDEKYNRKKDKTLDYLCKEYQPTLVLQSPYDVPIAEKFSKKHKLDYLWDGEIKPDLLVQAARDAERTIGFRLHFGMLSLSYGKPSTFIATDTRVSEFCTMMSLPFHNIKKYSNRHLLKELNTPIQNMEPFLCKWREFRNTMDAFLVRNGLMNNL